MFGVIKGGESKCCIRNVARTRTRDIFGFDVD